MLSTPTYKSLKASNLQQNVYEPAEDTFLFLDALELELKYLNGLNPLLALEIGSGSGLVITFLAKHLSELNKQTKFYAIDINQHACKATKLISIENNCDVNVINGDLLFAINNNISNEGLFDIIMFNAPYVVTDTCEISIKNSNFNHICTSWAGGIDGREIMDRLFPLIPKLLTKAGVFYLVCIKPNKIDEIENIFTNLGFKMIVLLNRKTSIENLFVLKFIRNSLYN